jgi:hypothetical protein
MDSGLLETMDVTRLSARTLDTTGAAQVASRVETRM